MGEKIAIVFSSFIICLLVIWGFDFEGGRYLQQIGLLMAGFFFGNMLSLIATSGE
jgi:hypothetical protein